MAKMGVVSEDQFKQELENCVSKEVERHNPIEGIVLPKTPLGRGKGNVAVPEELQKLIGDEALTNGRQAALDLASDFGISPSSVSAYTVGATSTKTYNKPEDTLVKYLESRKRRITKKSLRVLQSALSVLTPEKLNGIRARDASAIAKDMSVISKNMEKQNETVSPDNKPQFVIYAPQVRDERSYETIVVSDNF
jgi:hypothetical protein